MSEKYLGFLVVEGKLIDVECMKFESNYLCGIIVEDLNDGLIGGFKGDNFLLICFYGMYQQDDCDICVECVEQKLELCYVMLLCCCLLGGVIIIKQWQVIDKFVGENIIYGSICLINCQMFQFYGILKKNVKLVYQMLYLVGFDVLVIVNDMNCNVFCILNFYELQLYVEVYEWVKKIFEYLLLCICVYVEIWFDQEKVVIIDEELIFGQIYLLCKFKITVVILLQNDIDLYVNDMNFVVIVENGKLVGFNLLVGGGFFIEYGNKKIYVCIVSEFGYLLLEYMLVVVEVVVIIQCDWGN